MVCGFCFTFFCFAKVGEEWFRKWCEFARLDEFNWKDLSRVIHSFAGLNIGVSVVGKDFFVAWSNAMLRPHIVFDADIAHVIAGLRKVHIFCCCCFLLCLIFFLSLGLEAI
jgi:thiosulfate reductase cytochrome b subunit